MGRVENALKFYYLATNLKYMLRSGWNSEHWNITKCRSESIAEHVYGTIMLAIGMQQEFKYDIDLERVILMLAIHEVGENIIGDITPHQNICKEEKAEIEHKAVKEIFSNIADSDYLYELMLEFDERKTLESNFAFYIDKLEANLQSKYYQDNGFHNGMDEQENNIVFTKDKTKRLIEDGASTPFDIWYGYDISLFEGDENFISAMNYLKDNDVSKLKL